MTKGKKGALHRKGWEVLI